MGTLPLPTTSKHPPAPSLQLRPNPTTPPPTCSHLMDSSLPLPLHPPLLNTYPPSAFTLPFTPPPPTSTQPIHNSPPHPNEFHQNLRILQWNASGLSLSRRAELIAFLSGNQYDLIFLQETHLSATKKFQISGYSTLRTDRTLVRQGPVPSGAHNTGGGVFTIIHLTWPSLLFLSPLFLPRTPTQTTSVLKFFFPTTLPYNSLTSTPLLSEALLLILAPGPSLLTSFQTPLTLLSLETSMLTTQPGTDSFALTRPEMNCFAGSLPLVWKS